MIKKIVSGGQTGADSAALDAAIKLGVAHGGWVPKTPHPYSFAEAKATELVVLVVGLIF